MREHNAALIVLAAGGVGAAGFVLGGWNPILGMLAGSIPMSILMAMLFASKAQRDADAAWEVKPDRVDDPDENLRRCAMASLNSNGMVLGHVDAEGNLAMTDEDGNPIREDGTRV